MSADRPGPCPATLDHAHGLTTCTESEQHEQHSGLCGSCAEDDELVWLTWTGEGRTKW